MNIAVLIKQVPGTTAVEIDPETGVLRRDGVESKLNPYDLFALECALSLRSKYGGINSIVTVTMGPSQAASVIREAVYMGCDRGYVISDRRFAGSDVLSTSRTLAQGLKKIGGFDLVICGKQTTDGDTAQVGPETAEALGIVHVSNVLEILSLENGCAVLLANMGDYEQTMRIPLPALITVEKDVNTPRLPSIRRKYELMTAYKEMNSSDGLVKVLTLDDFDERDPKRYGLNGSPTQVEKIFPPESNTDKQIYEGTGTELSAVLYGLLRDMKII